MAGIDVMVPWNEDQELRRSDEHVSQARIGGSSFNQPQSATGAGTRGRKSSATGREPRIASPVRGQDAKANRKMMLQLDQRLRLVADCVLFRYALAPSGSV